MKAHNTRDVKAALRATVRPIRPAEDFWQDFRARAELVHQDKRSRQVAPVARWLLTVGAAAAVLLVVFSLAGLWPGSAGNGDGKQVAAVPAVQTVVTGALSRIEEVQVFVDNAGVMVFEDSENGGTVVFVETIPPPNHT